MYQRDRVLHAMSESEKSLQATLSAEREQRSSCGTVAILLALMADFDADKCVFLKDADSDASLRPLQSHRCLSTVASQHVSSGQP